MRACEQFIACPDESFPRIEELGGVRVITTSREMHKAAQRRGSIVAQDGHRELDVAVESDATADARGGGGVGVLGGELVRR